MNSVIISQRFGWLAGAEQL